MANLFHVKHRLELGADALRSRAAKLLPGLCVTPPENEKARRPDLRSERRALLFHVKQ